MDRVAVPLANISLRIIACSGLCVLATHQAWAAPPPWANSRARTDRQYDDARVIEVDPIVTRVRVAAPRRECWEEVQTEYRSTGTHAESAGPMILGGIIGGVVGSQVGRGHGQDVATVAGTLIGASIGHATAVRRAAVPVERTVEQCRTRYENTYQERVEAYRVTYEYLGREYTTELPYDPGDRIRVRVAVSPAQY